MDIVTRQCKTKKSFFILYCTRLFVSLASPKILSLDNKNKIAFYFVLYSFIRIFAEQKVLRRVTVAAISRL